jgi:hypothetical protein
MQLACASLKVMSAFTKELQKFLALAVFEIGEKFLFRDRLLMDRGGIKKGINVSLRHIDALLFYKTKSCGINR